MEGDVEKKGKCRRYYLVYSGKTRELLARGTYDVCAAKLGYKRSGWYSTLDACDNGRMTKYIIKRANIYDDLACPCYFCPRLPKIRLEREVVSCSCDAEECDTYTDWAVRYLTALNKKIKDDKQRGGHREFFCYFCR